jgi:hypothetical protein
LTLLTENNDTKLLIAYHNTKNDSGLESKKYGSHNVEEHIVYRLHSELSMGWVDSWVGLGWVGLGRVFRNLNGLGWMGSLARTFRSEVKEKRCRRTLSQTCLHFTVL